MIAQPHVAHDRAAAGLIEVVGPAGCGKSTLLRALATAAPSTRTDLSLWRQPRLFLLRGLLVVLPVVARALIEGTPAGRREIAQMVRIEALRLRVEKALRGDDTFFVVDEGVLFGLAWLRVFHDAGAGRHRLAWRRRALRHWADILGGIIRLDAANAVVAARIRGRRKPHPLKAATDAEIARFTDDFRRAFDGILSEFRAESAAPIIERRTDEAPSHLQVPRLNGTLRVVGSRV